MHPLVGRAEPGTPPVRRSPAVLITCRPENLVAASRVTPRCILRVSTLGETGCDHLADRRIRIDRSAPCFGDFDVARVVEIELRERLARWQRREIAKQRDVVTRARDLAAGHD